MAHPAALAGTCDSDECNIMKDLTQGSMTRLILEMAAPIAAGMIFQTLYLLVDL
jgi:Na+-driven multidrug efflux pump